MFCESILEYLADKELAMRTRISAEGFEGAVYSAYEHMYSQWLPSKESKVRVCIYVSVCMRCACVCVLNTYVSVCILPSLPPSCEW